MSDELGDQRDVVLKKGLGFLYREVIIMRVRFEAH